ncbi:MAG TPA: phytanoyl-CoA dioxygenase family protein [Reyranella sp.]|nr:phytanoyl-CoA dioxygenase family protein [Reyranella sp.]
MELSAQQLELFDRDGFLVFPDLFARNEVAVLRREVARLSQVQSEEVVREHTGGVRTIFRVHETDGPTRSQPFRALVRTPRLLRPVQQVLKDDGVYVYHTKINTKPAIEGTVWQWHQDYGSWMRDGCRRPDMATFNVMMTDTTEMGGALYLIPGSHKLGRIEPVYDESTSYKFWAMPKQRMIEILKSSPEPVAVTGRAGTCVLFHCNVLHASGHNLSADDRWHIYISCNTVANKPQLGPEPRPDWVVSRNWNPLPIEDDQGVLKAA